MTRRRDESAAEWLERTNARASALAVREHYVYRAFDSYGLLLYIGCTVDTKKRMAQHRSGASWFRFAETLATVAYPSRSSGFEAEKVAIDSEGSYFNARVEDMVRTNANRVAAQQRVHARGISVDPIDLARYEAGDEEYLARHEAEYEFWDRTVEREKALLKDGSHPYLTDADRLARYLAAREDAELARLEAVA